MPEDRQSIGRIGVRAVVEAEDAAISKRRLMCSGHKPFLNESRTRPGDGALTFARASWTLRSVIRFRSTQGDFATATGLDYVVSQAGTDMARRHPA